MPAVMFYVQHLLGIGHLMRARFIAEALADSGFDVYLVSGGNPIGERPPRGVRTIQLPPIHATDPGMNPLRAADGRPVDTAYCDRRRDLLLAAFESVAPDAVIFETFPFGRRALHFELLPLLERIGSTRPRPLVVSSVRDILQRRQKAGREREMLELAERWFDAVLVHGDRRFASFDETFPLAPELGHRLHYTGFVAAPDAPPAPLFAGTREEIVVSAGGGTVGRYLLDAAVAVQKSTQAVGPWRLLVGANVAEDDLRHLARDAGAGAIVERARPDFAALLARALISVSQAGYNTVLDVVRSGARPVLVPYAESGETEQRARAKRLRELDLAVVVDESPISATALAGAIDAAMAKERWGSWYFDCDGAARSAALVNEMLRAPRARRAVQARSGLPLGGTARIVRGAPMNAWRTLDDELDRWQAAARCATFWWRDDDACRDSPALARLLGIARAAGVPITLAVIPAMLEPGLVLALARSTLATVVQHGYAHRNYAPAGERKRELGGDRPVAVTVAELAEGFAALRRDFEDRFAAVLVPPWNRIDNDVVAGLRDAGYYGLSTFGPRAAACPSPGILQCNTHVDLVAWRHDREFIGTEQAIIRVASHLRARREGAADASEPSGILTHHLVMQQDGWQFLAELMARTRARGATWLDARGAFAAPVQEGVTCGRSA